MLTFKNSETLANWKKNQIGVFDVCFWSTLSFSH